MIIAVDVALAAGGIGADSRIAAAGRAPRHQRRVRRAARRVGGAHLRAVAPLATRRLHEPAPDRPYRVMAAPPNHRPPRIASPSACAPTSRARCCSTRFSRGRYSTDASMYQIEPVGVVVPKTEDDVRAALEIAREEGVSLLPRGGGTSQSGQTVGRSLVIDFTKHLNQLIEVDAEARTCDRAAGHRARRAEPAAQVDGPVVSGRCLDRQPRHHRRHDRQQLVRHALDPLRHHARQRAGHRRHPARRQRGALRRGRAQPCSHSPALPSPLRGGAGGGGSRSDARVHPTPNPSPQGGGDAWRATRPLPRPARARPARGGAHRARLPRGLAAASAAI